MRLAFTSYLDAIAEEADRLDSLLGANLERKVPACPAWTTRELLAHVARVFSFWGLQVKAAQPEARVESDREPSAEELATCADELIGSLQAAGPASPCWNWSGEEVLTSWVARQIALEAAVHRVDGEQSQGRFLPVEAELAIDGIEQRLAVHLATDLLEHPGLSLGGTLCLVCDDAPAAFVVEVERGKLRWRHGRGPADTVLVGSASDLFLFSWNRIAPEALRRTGDPAVAEAWRLLPAD